MAWLPDSDGRFGVMSLGEGDKSDATMTTIFILGCAEDEDHLLHGSHFTEMRLNHLFRHLGNGSGKYGI